MAQPLHGQLQVVAHLGQGTHMALAGHVHAFGCGLPAHGLQQALAQFGQAQPGLG